MMYMSEALVSPVALMTTCVCATEARRAHRLEELLKMLVLESIVILVLSPLCLFSPRYQAYAEAPNMDTSRCEHRRGCTILHIDWKCPLLQHCTKSSHRGICNSMKSALYDIATRAFRYRHYAPTTFRRSDLVLVFLLMD